MRASGVPRHSRTSTKPNEIPRELGVWCEKCNNRLVELKRQVMRMILPEIQGVLQKDRRLKNNAGSLSARIFDQIRIPETQMKSWKNDQCEVCATDLNQLKREAVAMVHTLEESQFLAYYNIPGYMVGPNADQLIRRADKQRLQAGVAMETNDRSGVMYVKPEEAAISSSFLSRAAQKLLSSKKKHKKGHSHKQEVLPYHPTPMIELTPSRHAHKEVQPYPFPSNYKEVLRISSPAVPPGLLKMHTKRTDGKVKVMLRICPSFPGETGSFMKVDQKRKQVTLYDPSTVGHVSQTHRKMGVAAPKMFAFDSIFESDCTQVEVCSGSLVDVLQAVVGGSEGCLFSYGHAGLGKTNTMVGRDEKEQTLGLIPCALSWLFRLISEQKQKTGTRFSVRVSAVEIVGRSETVRDLLTEQASGPENGSVDPSPSVFLREDRNGGDQEINPTELRVASAEKAAYYLDAALAARTRPVNNKAEGENTEWEESLNSHMFFTVHIYQYRVEKNSKNAGGVHGGRSRLHLIDLASCEGYTGSKKDGGASSMSLSGLGNVIISLINGAKHVPHRTSKITRMLQESIGNTSCRTTMIAHVSPSLPFYAETLATVQLATRLHRLRKRKGKGSGTSSSGGESSCDEARIRKPRLRTAEPRLRTTALNEKLREDCPIGEPGSSDYNSSTGEESCDTVIYVGPDGAISDRDLTDNEGPPTRLPIRKSSVSSSTRSLVRKLEAIENGEAEDNDEDVGLKREVEGSEDSSSLYEDRGKEEIFSEREEGEGREFSEEYTEESCYETEIEVIPESRASSRKRLLEKKGSSSSLSDSSLKGSVKRSKRQESDTFKNPVVKEISAITATAVNTLIIPSGLSPNLDIDESMNSRNSTVVIPVQSFPGEDAKLRTRVMSPETSSESSDAESIVMAKAPSFSFLTCEAVNEIQSKSMESLDAEQDLYDYEMSRQDGITHHHFNTANVSTTSLDFERDVCDDEVLHHFESKANQASGDTTAELIENCQPHSPVSDTPDLCYVLEETREASSDDFSYDDTELDWGKQLADDAIIAEAFCEEEEYDIDVDSHLERNFTGSENDVLFPELEESLQDIDEGCTEPVVEKVVPQKQTHRPSSDESSADSDTDATRSYTFGTPMKMFYRLVPSPQSSSTEDELEDIQVSKSFKSKTLSPIPEFPSVESNLNQASANFGKNRASCSYSIVSVEIDDGNTTIRVEGDKENIPMKDITNTTTKGDLRSLLQKFVAEQLRECEGEKFSSRYARPAPQHPEYRRPRPKPNRRIIPLASCDTSGNDMLLPPLVPQKRTCTETARLISSPKLRYEGEKDYDSDNAPYRCRAKDEDESSDSSMTAKTEPWCTPSRSAARSHFDPANPRLSSFSVGNVKTSVTFLGSEDENNNFHKTSNLEQPCVIENCDMENSDIFTSSFSERISRKDSGRVEHFVRAGNSPTRRRDRTSISSVSSFVKLTYCGSEMSDAEFEKPDEPSTKDKQSSNILVPKPNNTISITVERPIIQCIPLQPETPYAPQEQFIARFHDRCAPPRIVYRLSGEFVATIPGCDATASQPRPSADGTQVGANRQYRLSGEFVATFTTSAETQNASTLALMSSSTEDGNNSIRTESTDVVWVANEPVVSTGDLTADEMPAPSTPVAVGSRNEKTRRFKFFGRDRSSYSSGHASDSSIGDSPGPRGRSRSLKRLKSLSSRSDAASSSGYESMRNDASHASSDSCSEKGLSRGKRKGRSRSASPGSSARKYSPRRWFSRKSLEPVQIKVYEVDDIEKLQQAMEPNFQWKDSEQRKTRIASLRQRQRHLKEEFSAAKNRLLDEHQRWSFGLRAEKELNWEDPRFIDALEVENNNLQKRITDCKSSIMMVTSFDKRTTQV